jgi:uncharacterized protein YjiS (DUF1127 family)
MSHFSRDPFPASPESWSVMTPARREPAGTVPGRSTPPAGFVTRLRQQLAVWRERSRMRSTLAALDSRMLRDLGISPGQADFEANQPFWRRPTSLR